MDFDKLAAEINANLQQPSYPGTTSILGRQSGMGDDLVKRLTDAANPTQVGGGAGSWEPGKGLLTQAATALADAQDTIARLEARADRMEKAMSRYLPDAAHLYDCLIGPHHEKCTCGLDEARAALSPVALDLGEG